MRILPLFGVVAVLLAIAGCKSGKGSPGGGFTSALGTLTAEYLIIDLASGQRETASTITDLLTDPRYQTTHMVFRRVAGGTTWLGSPAGARWAQPDESERQVSVAGCFLGVFEVTRAQWQALGGGDPALAVTPASLAVTTDPLVPVHGLSLEAAQSVVGAWTLGGSLGIPTADQWERACRAGTTTGFSWGEATDPVTARTHAVVANYATAGLQPVAQRTANAWGFHDMHGNIWEWTAGGELRGGSWNDTLPMARSANRLVLDPSTAYALAGIRLTYAP